ncbi:MAG TPA: isoamylase early set domain-containing protein [Gemmatimonadales bacterium]|jgi:hypothetical protein
MSDELAPDDPLQPALADLRRPVGVEPGLWTRARVRARRRIVSRTVRVVVLVLCLGAADFFWRQHAGTSVTFALTAPSVRSVALVGDFNDWRIDQVKLHRVGNGGWETTVRLAPGRYRFAYLVNHDEWRADARAASVADDFGRPTSVVTVLGR